MQLGHLGERLDAGVKLAAPVGRDPHGVRRIAVLRRDLDDPASEAQGFRLRWPSTRAPVPKARAGLEKSAKLLDERPGFALDVFLQEAHARIEGEDRDG